MQERRAVSDRTKVDDSKLTFFYLRTRAQSEKAYITQPSDADDSGLIKF